MPFSSWPPHYFIIHVHSHPSRPLYCSAPTPPSDFPTLRRRLCRQAPRQTFACPQVPISLYDLCTFMDTFGLYSLLASCSLRAIRLRYLANLYIDLCLQWDPYPFLFGSPARYVASCSLLLRNRLTSDPLPVAEPACHFQPPPARSCPYSRKGSRWIAGS